MYTGVRGQIVLFDHVRSNSREVLPIGCQAWDDLELCGVLSTGIRKSVLKSVQRHPVEFLWGTYLSQVSSGKGLDFCLRQENSLLQECISVLEKRFLYYRSAFLSWRREFFTRGVHFCLGEENSLLQECMFCPWEENSLLQECMSVLEKRILYYRSAFLSWRREFFTTGVHFCLGEENSLLQECRTHTGCSGVRTDTGRTQRQSVLHRGSWTYTEAAGRFLDYRS